MDFLTLLDYLIRGLSLGSIYAIIALGYTMVYGIAKMLNFAHGDVIMVGGYICFFTMSGLSASFAAGSLAASVIPALAGVLLSVFRMDALLRDTAWASSAPAPRPSALDIPLGRGQLHIEYRKGAQHF